MCGEKEGKLCPMPETFGYPRYGFRWSAISTGMEISCDSNDIITKDISLETIKTVNQDYINEKKLQENKKSPSTRHKVHLLFHFNSYDVRSCI